MGHVVGSHDHREEVGDAKLRQQFVQALVAAAGGYGQGMALLVERADRLDHALEGRHRSRHVVVVEDPAIDLGTTLPLRGAQSCGHHEAVGQRQPDRIDASLLRGPVYAEGVEGVHHCPEDQPAGVA